MIIPRGVDDWKKVIPCKSYLEAGSINDYAKNSFNYYKHL